MIQENLTDLISNYPELIDILTIDVNSLVKEIKSKRQQNQNYKIGKLVAFYDCNYKKLTIKYHSKDYFINYYKFFIEYGDSFLPQQRCFVHSYEGKNGGEIDLCEDNIQFSYKIKKDGLLNFI